MKQPTHPQMVKALVKPGQDILISLGPKECNAIHMILGISGEAGELLDAIKKHVIYQKALDIQNIIEELGDIEFYLEGLRQQLSITRKECLSANVKKLSERYKGFQYSNDQAIARKDKQ